MNMPMTAMGKNAADSTMVMGEDRNKRNMQADRMRSVTGRMSRIWICMGTTAAAMGMVLDRMPDMIPPLWTVWLR